MSGYFYQTKTDEKTNFLDSSVGLVLKTAQFDGNGLTADEYGLKIIKAGTVYPSDDSNALGIVFEDVDVTYGEKAGSLLVAGRVIKARLNISSAAVTALAAKGLVFVDMTDTDRTAVPDTDSSSPQNSGNDS